MRFSVQVIFHLKAEDPYLVAKQSARHCAEHFSNGSVTLEGVDTTLNGLFAPLEPGAKEVMVGFTVEVGSLDVAKQTARQIYGDLSRQLGKGFIHLPEEEDRIVVEAV